VTPTERRRRITDVFELAVKLRPEDRDGFIGRECGGDDVLFQDVKSLLSVYHRIGDSLVGISPLPMEAKPTPQRQRIGKYAITQEIGSGGFGHVYRALDPTFDRVVAIKVLNAPDNLDMVRRFRAEAKTVANLHHKNIVTVHDFGEEDGVPYLVMEYLEGTTLQALIDRNSLSLLEKVEIMSEAAAGLQYAHERGVTHRDVKPANIMRLADGSVKIMDFGIARMAEQTSTRLTQTGFVIGSLMYMAPEQFAGTSDALTDVFGYGVTFYELLTGRNPFSSSDPAIIIFRITNTDPPAVRSLAPECPEALDRIVRGALARSREARYSSLSDVVADTRAILSDLRRDQAVKLYAEAGQFFVADQLDAAKSAVRKALDLDPVHAGARRLRSEIEEALRRRDLASRARSLMDQAEGSLRERRYEEAEGLLDSVRQLGLSDPQLKLKARVEGAAIQIEQARRCEKLVEAAREDLKNQNLPAGVAAPSGEESAQAPAVLPEPAERAVERPATDLPFLGSQLGPNSFSKRTIELAASGFVVIAVVLGWWLALQKPKDVPGNQPVRVEQGKQAPAPRPPASTNVQGGDLPARSTAVPPDRELSTLRSSAVSAIRARDWSKADWLIDDLLAKLPTDAEALEWRKLLSEGRKSDLFAKLNPKQAEPNGAALARAEQLLQQGEYPAAIALFQRALATDPGSTRARNGLKQATDAKATEDRVFGGGR
jgi:tetratricopeptide (TPR) repeat protein